MNELTLPRCPAPPAGRSAWRAALAPARVLCTLLLAAGLLPPAWAQLRPPAPASTQPVGPGGGLGSVAPAPAPPVTRASTRGGDYILAIVNQELVTAGELALRIERVREASARSGSRLPPEDELRRQVLDALIDERVQITHARETGQRVDESELDRAVTNVALQNQITPAQLRVRLQQEGVDYGRFRNNIRDQILVERIREREVQGRIRVSEAEIDALIEQQRAAAGGATQYNIAQILIPVPEGADAARVASQRSLAEAALTRVRGGEAFEAVARELSADANRAEGGAIGLRPADRLPDVFVERVRGLAAGEVANGLLQTGAGFHVLKLLERRDAAAFSITQTRARHILLRPTAQLSQEAAVRRLAGFKTQITGGRASFEDLARDNSEDGSAVAGGDLGWTTPGSLVPEFETTMNALPIGGISDPVVSRFGVHLIQVMERRDTQLDSRQQREQARNVLRERKFEAAYVEWLSELRARAYIEMREPPT